MAGYFTGGCERTWTALYLPLDSRPLGKQHEEALVIYSHWWQAPACNWFTLILVHSIHASHTEFRTWHKRILKLPLYSPSRYGLVMPWICCWRFYRMSGENVLPALLSEMCCANNRSGDLFTTQVYTERKWNYWYGHIGMCGNMRFCFFGFFCVNTGPTLTRFLTICTIQLAWKEG